MSYSTICWTIDYCCSSMRVCCRFTASISSAAGFGAQDASKSADCWAGCVCTYCHSVCAVIPVAVVSHCASAQHYTLLKMMGMGGCVLILCCLNSSVPINHLLHYVCLCRTAAVSMSLGARRLMVRGA